MSTPNFKTPNYDLAIVACGMENELEDWEYSDIQSELDTFNSELTQFEVYLEPGYYQGAMLDVRQTNDYWDYADIDEITDEDAQYFFGENAKDIKETFANEMQKIKDFFAQITKNDSRFLELIKVAQFSNGEAIYKKASA